MKVGESKGGPKENGLNVRDSSSCGGGCDWLVLNVGEEKEERKRNAFR